MAPGTRAPAPGNEAFRSGERLTLTSDLLHGARLRVIVVAVDADEHVLTREHMLRASWTVAGSA